MIKAHHPGVDAGENYDLIVIGAGGIGMVAALFGAIAGLRVLVVEKTEFVGGTTSFSAGTTWIPNSHLAATVGAEDSLEKAATYLRNVVGDASSEAMRMAFLRNGPLAIEKLEKESDLHFKAFSYHPDYQSDVEGATTAGRALEPLPFNGRLLGRHFTLIRPPIPEFTVLGGMMVDRYDIGHLMKLTRSSRSFLHSSRLFLGHAKDRIRHKRGTRLVMGNAFVARLLHSLRQRKVSLWTNTEVDEFRVENGRVTGISVDRRGKRFQLNSRLGVILASGGFNRNPELRRKLVNAAALYSPIAPGNTGAAIDFALQHGATLGEVNYDSVLWAPVSVRKRKDETMAVFPHFVLDRGKPGTIVVNQAGKRFVNETTSYHLFGHAMVTAHDKSPCIPAFLIADRRALKAYGLGMVRPGGKGLKPFLQDGYLLEAPTLEELAEKIAVDPQALHETVDRMNDMAETGVDSDFGRGSTLYQRNLGDPKHAPNPTLGYIEKPPFYAVRLYPGDIAACTGLVTDENARVLSASGSPIEGLYAVGNDMNSIMGGTYPAPGITLGPGIAFAYLAVEHAARAAAPDAHDEADQAKAELP